MRNPLPEYVGRVTHDCGSIIAKKTSCSHCFSHGASLHHCSFSFTYFCEAIKFISSFHLPPVVGDEKNTKYKTHSKLGEREDSIQGTVNL